MPHGDRKRGAVAELEMVREGRRHDVVEEPEMVLEDHRLGVVVVVVKAHETCAHA